MKANTIPLDSNFYWLRCERPAVGQQPAEIWYSATGLTKEGAENERDICSKQWPEIRFEVADFVPGAAAASTISSMRHKEHA